MSNVEEITEKLRVVYEERPNLWEAFVTLNPYFAERVELTHYPISFPMDKVYDGAEIVAMFNPETFVDQMTALLDDYREVVRCFSVTDAAVTLFVYMSGRLPDGTDVRVPAAFVCAFSGDLLSRIDVHSDPLDFAAFSKHAVEAGYGMPDDEALTSFATEQGS